LLLYVPFHNQSRFKNDYFLWGHRDFLTGTRISAQTATARLDLENAKVAKLYGLSGGKILGDFVESALHHTLYVNLLDTGLAGDFQNNVFLCDGHSTLRWNPTYR